MAICGYCCRCPVDRGSLWGESTSKPLVHQRRALSATYIENCTPGKAHLDGWINLIELNSWPLLIVGLLGCTTYARAVWR